MLVGDYIFSTCAIVYLIALLVNFRLALAFLPLFFPLYLWKFSPLPVNFVEVAILLATLVWGMQLVFRKKWKDYWDKSFWKEWGWWLLFLVILSVAAVYQAMQTGVVTLPYEGKEFDSLKVALGIFKGWILLPILFFVLWKNVLSNSWYKKISWGAYLTTALILSLWALWQVATAHFITIDGRASGPFISANYLSLYIGPAVLGFALMIWEKWSKVAKIERLLLLFLFFTCFFALIESRSYASFLAVIAGFSFYVLFQFKSWKKIVSAGIIVLVLSSIFIFFQKDTEKFKLLFEFDQRSSSAVRVQTWTIATNLVRENWLTGIGLGQFEAQYQLEAKNILGKEPYELIQLHPHNIFLAFWLNLGLLGFLFFIGLIYKFVGLKRKDNALYLSLIVLVLVHGLFDLPFWKNDLSLLWWMLIAFL